MEYLLTVALYLAQSLKKFLAENLALMTVLFPKAKVQAVPIWEPEEW